ncbi:hypothetical protein RFI_23135 [Reticulomyxa filosa]|uniref:Uncharacterized protein n=1 Tax=Reticulomyxa filosa TaxID=46433 RepID=X6MJP2_RETFI|nr:hypothetical protein RFI_23135 [Reticulomyxa filosa]|eukprot:ETO14233.1 hypothetical protein RFI_23135 [Reticulomyxa filosa]
MSLELETNPITQETHAHVSSETSLQTLAINYQVELQDNQEKGAVKEQEQEQEQAQEQAQEQGKDKSPDTQDMKTGEQDDIAQQSNETSVIDSLMDPTPIPGPNQRQSTRPPLRSLSARGGQDKDKDKGEDGRPMQGAGRPPRVSPIISSDATVEQNNSVDMLTDQIAKDIPSTKEAQQDNEKQETTEPKAVQSHERVNEPQTDRKQEELTTDVPQMDQLANNKTDENAAQNKDKTEKENEQEQDKENEDANKSKTDNANENKNENGAENESDEDRLMQSKPKRPGTKKESVFTRENASHRIYSSTTSGSKSGRIRRPRDTNTPSQSLTQIPSKVPGSVSDTKSVKKTEVETEEEQQQQQQNSAIETSQDNCRSIFDKKNASDTALDNDPKTGEIHSTLSSSETVPKTTEAQGFWSWIPFLGTKISKPTFKPPKFKEVKDPKTGAIKKVYTLDLKNVNDGGLDWKDGVGWVDEHVRFVCLFVFVFEKNLTRLRLYTECNLKQKGKPLCDQDEGPKSQRPPQRKSRSAS